MLAQLSQLGWLIPWGFQQGFEVSFGFFGAVSSLGSRSQPRDGREEKQTGKGQMEWGVEGRDPSTEGHPTAPQPPQPMLALQSSTVQCVGGLARSRQLSKLSSKKKIISFPYFSG